MAANNMIPRIAIDDEADRRRRPRLRLAYPLRIHLPGESIWVETTTEDLSCEGFSCISDRSFSLHQVLECELLIPSEELGRPMGRNLVLRCQAQVVRVVTNGHEAPVSLACRLDDYTIHQPPVDRTRVFETLSLPFMLSSR
jgi:hypothetical protein